MTNTEWKVEEDRAYALAVIAGPLFTEMLRRNANADRSPEELAEGAVVFAVALHAAARERVQRERADDD